MLTDKLFIELVRAASLAASADNMQPWEFRRQYDSIEVFCARERILPTDVIGMFAWVGVGAAIQNLVVEAEGHGLTADIEYSDPVRLDMPAAIVRFSTGDHENALANCITLRATNRSPYETIALDEGTISRITKEVRCIDAGIHWATSQSCLDCMASMDANSTYIRLEHKPLHDELFDILRFTRKEIESTRFGLDFESLEVPSFAVMAARQLQYWSVNRAISRLGLGRVVARKLAARLRKAGALCLVTARRRDPEAYMEAGRAMEHLWLAATAEGLSIQPYGVLPQYLTKVDIEPETFLPNHAAVIRSHLEPFNSIFPDAKDEFPAIVLRVGRAHKQSPRSNIRLRPDQIIRN